MAEYVFETFTYAEGTRLVEFPVTYKHAPLPECADHTVVCDLNVEIAAVNPDVAE